MTTSYYFSHDYNARNDDKIKQLIRKRGILGYGVFWAIIEDLYNNANALRLDYEGIAFDLRVDCEVVNSVINDFGLFIIDGDFFGSMSVQKRIDEREEKSQKAKYSARKRWEKKDIDANALRTLSDGNAIKERKGKEIKETNKSFESFWNLYDKKEDNKKCKDLFEKLPEQTQQKILQVVPLYVSKTPDKKFRKHPLTWLRGNCWDDDYSDATQQVQKKKPEPKYFHNQEDYESALAEWNAKNPTSNLHDIQGHLL